MDYQRTFTAAHAQSDTTVLNPVISPKLSVARFTSILEQSHDLHEILLNQKEALLDKKYSTGSIPLLTPAIALGHVAVQRILPLPQILRNVVEKTSGVGQEHCIPYPIIWYQVILVVILLHILIIIQS